MGFKAIRLKSRIERDRNARLETTKRHGYRAIRRKAERLVSISPILDESDVW